MYVDYYSAMFISCYQLPIAFCRLPLHHFAPARKELFLIRQFQNNLKITRV